MLTQISKVIISVILSGLAAALYAVYGGAERKGCLLGMLASTLGDLFMTDIVGMGQASAYPGAAFFILAHVLYAVCFIRTGRRKGYRMMNGGMLTGIGLTVFAAVLLTAMMLAVTGRMQEMFLPILAYLLFIGFDLCCQFSYAASEGGTRKLLTAGMLLFLVSDLLVFMPMLGIIRETPAFNDGIWFTYIPAQLLILLFNSGLRRG